MDHTHIALTKWFLAAFMLLQDEYCSAIKMQRVLGLKRYEPGFYMLHKLRESMATANMKYENKSVHLAQCVLGGIGICDRDKVLIALVNDKLVLKHVDLRNLERFCEANGFSPLEKTDRETKIKLFKIFKTIKDKMNLRYHGVDPKRLQPYLDQCTFMWNRNDKAKAFHEMLGLVEVA
ncbi:MAG: hypothetical protein PHS53_04660 [Candidatus Pacebacteria bacterium]|nr:hypothetical protein [Candidatus Paceibacterota bacterium]MDD5357410.1 hypothetical protein [Candidatus Paceibacterota bacterium]